MQQIIEQLTPLIVVVGNIILIGIAIIIMNLINKNM
jgi:hypothetical protein